MKRYIKGDSGKPLIYGFLVFLIAAILASLLAYQNYLIIAAEKQKEVIQEMNAVNYRLKNAISNGLSATKTLAFIIERYGIPSDFDSIAKHIIESNKYIDALELTNQGVITNVYPLKGNEAAIGLDVLKDSAARSEAYKAINKRELYFAGPLTLKQGGIAVVGRLPLFNNDRFTGFAVVIIKLQTLLAAAGIDQNSSQFVYQLSKFNTNTKKEEFFLSASERFDSTIGASVHVPDGEWKLYILHKEKVVPSGFLSFFILGFVFSSLCGIFTWYIVRQPQKLNELVNLKTAELIKMQKTISESESRLTEAQEVAKIGSWETDLKTLKIIWSKETFKIFEIDDPDYTLSYSDFLQFIHPHDREEVNNVLTNPAYNSRLNKIEHRIVTAKNNLKHVEERWRMFYDENGLAIRMIGTCQDITERIKQAELAKENEKNYKYLFENNPIPMLLWDFETLKIIDCNDEALYKYGYTREEFLNLTIRDLRPPEDIPLIEDAVRSEKSYGSIHKRVWRHTKKDGTEMLININARLINYRDGKVSLVMIDEVTEKIKAEKELLESNKRLHELTGHLQVVREEERTAIAREIHDELGQLLTAIKMDTEWVTKKLSNTNLLVTEKLHTVIALIDETVKTIRRISSDLRPGILDDLGLIAALEWQSGEYEKRTGIKVIFNSNTNDIEVDKNVCTNIFRIFQEALTNIIRHSEATKVEIQLLWEHDHLILKIADNGKGFDPDTIKNSNTWGIIGMRERAMLLGAEFYIESEEKKGSRINLRLFLKGK